MIFKLFFILLIHFNQILYSRYQLNHSRRNFKVYIIEPSGVQALKNPNPLKDDEAFVVLGVAVLV